MYVVLGAVAVILAMVVAWKALRRPKAVERKEPSLEASPSSVSVPASPVPAAGRRVTITLATARKSSRLAWAAHCRAGANQVMLTGSAWLGGRLVTDLAATVVALRAARTEGLIGMADVVTLRLPETAATLLSGERPPRWEDEVSIAQEIAKMVIDGGFNLLIETGTSRRCEQQAKATLFDQDNTKTKPAPLAATA